MKNDLRTAVVALFAVVVGFVGAWFVLGARATQLAEDNEALRRQAALIQQIADARPPRGEEQLLGRWATTVEKSRLGKIELIFDMRGDGSVVWQSVSDKQQREIASGQWRLDRDDVHFAVTVTDEQSPEKGRSRTTVASIEELTTDCLTLIVDGDEWSFHRVAAL